MVCKVQEMFSLCCVESIRSSNVSDPWRYLSGTQEDFAANLQKRNFSILPDHQTPLPQQLLCCDRVERVVFRATSCVWCEGCVCSTSIQHIHVFVLSASCLDWSLGSHGCFQIQVLGERGCRLDVLRCSS